MANSQPLFLPRAQASDAAWLFPGQGAQEPGMGKDVWQASAAARQVFQTADRVLGYALSEICFEGPADLLRDTEHAQPAIFTTSLACLAAAIEGGSITASPAFMAGHSLGEYSALVAAGSMSLEDGLLLLQQRARLMSEASRIMTGTMAAIMGLEEAAVSEVCAQAGIDICNFNLPSQTVVGGGPEGVARAMALAKERGARVAELTVSGAFHSRLMRPAVDGLKAAVASADIEAPAVPVIANASATALIDTQAVRDELGAQVAQPVRWHESVSLMARAGVITFVEFGPGKVLTGMARRLVPGSVLVNVSGVAGVSTGQRA